MKKCVVITGATGAIGEALSLVYATSTTLLILQGRNKQRLEELALKCENLGASVVIKLLDVQNLDALQAWFQELSKQYTLDLVVINAGMNTHIGSSFELEPWDEVDALVDINLKAPIAIVHAIAPSMRERKSGQIALVSSLAGYFGLPVTPTYCASKAGLKAYGEALRGLLSPEGVKVNVIMPGYVKSPMCDAMPGPKPFLWSPKHAAVVIKKGLEKDKARISFPFPLNWGTWWLAVLPAAISHKIVTWLGYRG